ncbi:MAG: ChaN family lipoprotein [Xanthomonadales bacterium]|nr:ChaN family lipoprotein [Xanthomonadales bacterium]
MKKSSLLLVSAITLGLGACASTTAYQAAEKTSATAVISPINTTYDTIWVRGKDSSVQSLEQVVEQLSTYDVVFFGEFHGHSGIHLAQMQVFEGLQSKNPAMTLSLEQIERDIQPLLDQYLNGEIGEKVLQKDGRGWDNYEQSYRPLVEYAKINNLPVLAANAPKDAVICVGKKGAEVLDKIPMPDRGWLAKELNLYEGPYRDKYLGFMGGSRAHGADTEDAADSKKKKKSMDAGMAMAIRSFSAQVLRDDTMAETIAMHLQGNPERKVLHLTGSFHSESGLGTVERLLIRMPELKVAVINPITVKDSQSPAWSEDEAKTGDFILLVNKTPPMFVNKDSEREYMNTMIRKRMKNKCVYTNKEA